MMMMGDDVVGREGGRGGGRDQADVVGGFIHSEEKRSLNVHFRLNVIESKYPIYYYYASVG